MTREFLSLTQLSRFLNKCDDTFARKNLEEKIINMSVSMEEPEGQSIGDLWLVEENRE